jgi:flagellar motor switch protein FliM
MNKTREYDFRKPQRYSSENIRNISILTDDFCRKSNMYLNYELKYRSGLNVVEIEQSSYQDFFDKLSASSIVVQVTIKPISKSFLLKIDKIVALIWVDIASGGDGNIEDLDRTFTDVDKNILTYLVNKLMEKLYIPEKFDSIEVEGIYTKVAMPQFFIPSDSSCISDVDVDHKGMNIGKISFCMPYSSMEEWLENYLPENDIVDKFTNDPEEFSSKLKESVYEANLNLSVEIGKVNITIGDLLKLEEGDILITDKGIDNPVDIYIENIKSYTAKPGIINSKRGLEVLDSVNKEV